MVRAGIWNSGVISYQPRDERLLSTVIFTGFAGVCGGAGAIGWRSVRSVPISELGEETFIAHNVLSPYREFVLKVFQERSVRLNMDIEMPTVETIRWMVEANQGVAFLPRMCVEQEISEKPGWWRCGCRN